MAPMTLRGVPPYPTYISWPTVAENGLAAGPQWGSNPGVWQQPKLPVAEGLQSAAACLHFLSSYFAIKEFLAQIARCKRIQEENAPLV